MQWDESWGAAITCRTGPGAPTVPKDVRATEVGSSSILLAWAAPDRDNGLPVTEYIVRDLEWEADPGKAAAKEKAKARREYNEYEEEDPDEVANVDEVYVNVDKHATADQLRKEAEAGGHSWGTEVYRDRPKNFLIAGLKPCTVYMFRVSAVNLAGSSVFTDKVCVRTLAEGSTEVTPWVMAVDTKTHNMFYMHPRTQAVTWTLPEGVLIDQAESFK